MGWFKNKNWRPPQQIAISTTRFVGEQDGPPERDLKSRFAEILRQEPMVQSAYLARAEHGDGTGVHVILAVRHTGGEDATIIPKLANIFSSMFGSHEHLDMMFVREDQEQQLRTVCEPFYRADG